jgi:HSP20 family protein
MPVKAGEDGQLCRLEHKTDTFLSKLERRKSAMADGITRWDPMTEMGNMRRTMDRLFGRSIGPWRWSEEDDEELMLGTLGMDVCETDDEMILRAAVPGIRPEDVDITIENDILTVKGEFKEHHEEEGERPIRRELRYGNFYRSLRLPPTIDVDKAEADFEHGMLRLKFPKKPESKPRSIKVTPRGVIEGERRQGEGQSERR